MTDSRQARESSRVPSTAPLWSPDAVERERTNLARLIRSVGVADYDELHAWSVRNPGAFWETTATALGVEFIEPYRQAVDLAAGPEHPQWFVGGKLNIAAASLARSAGRTAIVTRRAGGGLERISTELLAALARRAAAGFVGLGLRPGDGVAIVAALTVETVAAYLGVILASGYAVSVPESLPAEEIATRLRIGNARFVVTQDVLPRGGKVHPLYDRVAAAGAAKTIVITAAATPAVPLRGGDLTWAEFLPTDDHFDPVACDPDACINVLFSSGTTGEPKAIGWEQTTPIKAAGDAHWHQDLQPGDVVAWPTSLGWMMGPWLVFSGLLNQATIALYDGGPIERGFCEFVADAGVTVLGVVPSIVRGWRRADLLAGLDWSAIRLFTSTGEASDADDYAYLMRLGGPAGRARPVIEYCGGSELAGGYIASTMLAPNAPSVFNAKVLGTDFVLLRSDGRECGPGEIGEVFLVPPSLGMTTRLLNRSNETVYYEGCPLRGGVRLRRHGDLMMDLGGSRYRSFGRADDTMNLGGIKTSSAEIERAVTGLPGVVEVAAVGVPPPGGGPDELVLFVITDGRPAAAVREPLGRAIHDHLNPLFRVADIVEVKSLPRTASNKLIRRQLRDEYRRPA
jgi:acetyl-CoA synthetase